MKDIGIAIRFTNQRQSQLRTLIIQCHVMSPPPQTLRHYHHHLHHNLPQIQQPSPHYYNHQSNEIIVTLVILVVVARTVPMICLPRGINWVSQLSRECPDGFRKIKESYSRNKHSCQLVVLQNRNQLNDHNNHSSHKHTRNHNPRDDKRRRFDLKMIFLITVYAFLTSNECLNFIFEM